QTTRPVVLEAAREHPLPARRQRGDDRVARVSHRRAAVPGEPHLAGTVDHLTRLRPQPVVRRHRTTGLHDGHRSPPATDRTRLLSVSRSTRKNRRQPALWYQVSFTQPRGLRCRYRYSRHSRGVAVAGSGRGDTSPEYRNSVTLRGPHHGHGNSIIGILSSGSGRADEHEFEDESTSA